MATNGLFRNIFIGQSRNLEIALRWTFWSLILLGVVGKLRLINPTSYVIFEKPIFPFSEESHYALTLGPFACAYMMQLKQKKRFLVPGLILILALWFPSTTILCIALILMILLVSLRNILIIVASSLVIFILFNCWIHYINIDYFKNRLNFEENNHNLTTMVYFQGWEQAWIATCAGIGAGVGFQRFGSEEPGENTKNIDNYYRIELNRQDGSCVGSKLVGEFGVIGMLALIAGLAMGVYAFVQLRRQKNERPQSVSYIIYCSVVYLYLIEIFLRGIGFFSPSFFLYLFSLTQVGAQFVKIKGNYKTSLINQGN